MISACSTENIEDWVGSYSTSVKDPNLIESVDMPSLGFKSLLSASLTSRFAYKIRGDKALFFVNGDKYALNRSDLNWIDALIKNRECKYEPDTSSAGKNCIEEMLSSGAITLKEGKH